MWFRFPEGCEAITVNQQLFISEVKDKDGRNYFRAPDHFAPLILDQPGFSTHIPETDLEDLDDANPEHASAMAQLGAQIDSLTAENARLKELNKTTAGNLKIEQEKNRKLEEEIEKLKKVPPFNTKG